MSNSVGLGYKGVCKKPVIKACDVLQGSDLIVESRGRRRGDAALGVVKIGRGKCRGGELEAMEAREIRR